MESVVRGHHVYKCVWAAVVREELRIDKTTKSLSKYMYMYVHLILFWFISFSMYTGNLASIASAGGSLSTGFKYGEGSHL